MKMNRRNVLAASLAITATPLLPRAAYAAAASVPIEFHANAIGHKFEALAGSWCIQRLREGILYCRSNDGFDRTVKLTDPHFKIVAGKPVWNWMTGYTEETGVAIFITEQGVPIGEAIGIGTSIGYEEYWDTARPENLPDYYVRQPWLSWDEVKRIEPHLPKNHLDFDMRWMKALKKERLA